MTGSSIRDRGALGDVDGKIAHAFEIGIDFERRDDQPEIGRHGLLQGEQVDGELVDLDFDFVDARLVAKHFLGGAAVFVNHGADAALDGRFDQRAHLQQLGLQLF